jgi:hypothetical protein
LANRHGAAKRKPHHKKLDRILAALVVHCKREDANHEKDNDPQASKNLSFVACNKEKVSMYAHAFSYSIIDRP